MEAARRRRWSADFSLCLCAFLYHVLGLQPAASGSVGRSGASNERTALDQALLLVEILKSEYAKVVSENEKLQKNMIISEPTCATTENPIPVAFTTTSPDKVETTLRYAPATPFGPFYRRSNSFHRRRWLPPAAFYYYGEPNDKRMWRRQDYDNDFLGPHPGINETQQTASDATAASNATAAPTTTVATVKTAKPPSPVTTVTTIKSAKTTVREKTYSSPIHTATKKITTYPSSSPTETTVREKTFSSPIHTATKKITTYPSSSPIKKIKLMLSSKKVSKATLSKQEREPELSQASEELVSKEVSKATSSPQGREPELSQASEEFAKELGNAVPRSVRERHLPVLWRGTTKVYLADSTRYPLPLPDNHAFCFTNPHSALCKTLI